MSYGVKPLTPLAVVRTNEQLYNFSGDQLNVHFT